jgi:prepilin-type N-terminal cleavage/methylation domain-containing protein
MIFTGLDAMRLKSSEGFTLIELVVTILIISVLSVIALIQWPSLTVSIGAQAERIASDLRFAQNLSMSAGQRICFLISGSGYSLIASVTGTSLMFNNGQTTTTLASGITFGTITPTNMFVFDGEGVPYSSSTTSCTNANAQAATALTATGSIIINGGGQTSTISISPETGRVLVQ